MTTFTPNTSTTGFAWALQCRFRNSEGCILRMAGERPRYLVVIHRPWLSQAYTLGFETFFEALAAAHTEGFDLEAFTEAA